MTTESRTIEDVEAEMRDVELQLAPLNKRMEQLYRERERLRSLQWIEAKGVRRDDVYFSSDPEFRGVITVDVMAALIRRITGNRKRFVEWNGVLYHTAEVIDGNLVRDAPGRAEHLPD